MVKTKKRKCVVGYVIIALLALGFSSFFVATSYADCNLNKNDSKLDEFAQNNILFYCPGASMADGCDYSFTDGSSISEIVLSYLMASGLNAEAAAGIYGNMMVEGLGSGALLEHENGVDDRGDIGTVYQTPAAFGRDPLPVTEKDVRELYDPSVMHGLGLIQWSWARRVNLLNALKEAGGLDYYATAWDDEAGKYVYDAMPYDKFVEEVGKDIANSILKVEMDFFMSEHEGYKVTADDIVAQGLSRYGITDGMNVFDALNLINDAGKAAELFFTTSEMPGYTTFDELTGPWRRENANKGYSLIQEAGITASGSECRGDGTIAALAVEMAWPENDGMCMDGGATIDWNNNKERCYDDLRPSYVEYSKAVFGDRGEASGPCSSMGGDLPNSLFTYSQCSFFVSVVLKNAGAVDWGSYKDTHAMIGFFNSEEGKSTWTRIENTGDTNNLMAGDVFVQNVDGVGGHVLIYTGDYSKYGNMVAASWCDHTPKMQNISFTYTRGGVDYEIYRYTGGSNGKK